MSKWILQDDSGSPQIILEIAVLTKFCDYFMNSFMRNITLYQYAFLHEQKEKRIEKLLIIQSPMVSLSLNEALNDTTNPNTIPDELESKTDV